jgi:hypothetical protein
MSWNTKTVAKRTGFVGYHTVFVAKTMMIPMTKPASITENPVPMFFSMCFGAILPSAGKDSSWRRDVKWV